MYAIFISDIAKKQLKKLPKDFQERIVITLRRCKIRPHAYVKKLTGNKYFRLRAGDYRIIMDIQDNKIRIFVIELGHRKNIYKKD